jgi:aminomethyltransferase
MLTDYFAARGVAQVSLPAGGSVPLRFSDPVREHLATRSGVGLFDFSFMGWWRIRGPEALPFLQRLQTRNLRLLRPGRACYTLLCCPDGTVLIDATVWCHDTDHYWLFSGRRSDRTHIDMCAAAFDVEVDELSSSYAIIAVQGPASARLLSARISTDFNSIAYFAFGRCNVADCDAWIARLGYTGELGYELLVPAPRAEHVWSHLAQPIFGVEPRECGMEAADSLRVEAGYIHFACELAQPATPAELRLSRLVRSGREDFVGREALRNARKSMRGLAGAIIDADRAHSFATFRHPRNRIRVTSEAFSPTLGRILALGFVDGDSDRTGIVYTSDARRARLARLPFRDPMRLRVRRIPQTAQATAFSAFR